MKKILFLCAVILFTSTNVYTQKAMPNLRGEQAVNRLKQEGLYNSLLEVVRETKQHEGQTSETDAQTADAVGQSAKLVASDGTPFDLFGWSMAISGNTAVVGAYLADVGANTGQGAAYVFVNSGTAWTLQQKLTAFGGAANDFFGHSVAISGNTIVVGANNVDVGTEVDQGAAYVFVRSGIIWSPQDKLTAADGTASDNFGSSVAIDGETIVVSAPSEDIRPNLGQGALYVFVRSDSTWLQQQKLTAQDGGANDNFGWSVAISGNTIIAGAYSDDIGANTDQGSAYIFVRSGTTWTQQQKLTASDGTANNFFGRSVALDGNTALAGAPEKTSGIAHGAVYVFARNGVTWTLQQKLIATDGTAGDDFGHSAAIWGNTIVVGAYSDDVGSNPNQGSAYIFVKSGNGWLNQQKLTAADGAANDLFGWSVAISGNSLLIGASRADSGTKTDQGAAYVFRILSDDWTQEAKKTPSSAATDNRFGGDVAISGNTAIVGSATEDIGTNIDQGAAYIFVRSGSTWTLQQKLIPANGAALDYFGRSVAIDGDTAIVAAPSNISLGSVYVFTRVNNVWTQQQQLTVANNDIGGTLAIDGDTLISTGIQGSPGLLKVYVFVKSGSAWTLQQQLTGPAANSGFLFILDAALSGDTMVIGDINGNDLRGAAYVFVRSGTTWTLQQKLTAADGEADDNFGVSVAIDGDTVIVGASDDNIGANLSQGSAYVFKRFGFTWIQQQKLMATDGAAGDEFGDDVAIDGGTIVVGADEDSIGANKIQGSAYVFVNNGSVWSEREKLTASDGTAFNVFGKSVSISGDKIVVGAPGANTTFPTGPGAVYFFINTPLITAASTASISGRVLADNETALSDVYVYLTDSAGQTRFVVTGELGDYCFTDVSVGETYQLTIVSDRYSFTPQTVTVSRESTGLDFVSQPLFIS